MSHVHVPLTAGTACTAIAVPRHAGMLAAGACHHAVWSALAKVYHQPCPEWLALFSEALEPQLQR